MKLSKLNPEHLKRMFRSPEIGDQLRVSIDDLANRIDQCEARIAQEGNQLRIAMLQQRSVMARVMRESGVVMTMLAPPQFPESKSYEESLLAFEHLEPKQYPIWRSRLEANDGRGVDGHPMAENFRGFLSIYLKGAVLDIGCGRPPIPAYLCDYPLGSIAGIDPIVAPHPFVFAHAVPEFLPWLEASFDTVVSATSLDQVLLLDRSLAEIRRVLKNDGRLILWIAFVPGAQFGQAIAQEFTIEEVFNFAEPEISTFYALRPKRRVD